MSLEIVNRQWLWPIFAASAAVATKLQLTKQILVIKAQTKFN